MISGIHYFSTELKMKNDVIPRSCFNSGKTFARNGKRRTLQTPCKCLTNVANASECLTNVTNGLRMLTNMSNLFIRKHIRLCVRAALDIRKLDITYRPYVGHLRVSKWRSLDGCTSIQYKTETIYM